MMPVRDILVRHNMHMRESIAHDDNIKQHEGEVGPNEQAPIGFETFLGEGFDAEYFSSMDAIHLPHTELIDRWNTFLQEENVQDLENKTIEQGVATRVCNWVTGEGKGPTLYPVFIQGLQEYYKKKGVSHDHVTPERMRRFYDLVSTGATG